MNLAPIRLITPNETSTIFIKIPTNVGGQPSSLHAIVGEGLENGSSQSNPARHREIRCLPSTNPSSSFINHISESMTVNLFLDQRSPKVFAEIISSLEPQNITDLSTGTLMNIL